MLWRFSVVCFVMGLSVSSSWARIWTDVRGGKFEGSLIRQEGSQVYLNIGGQQRVFQLSQLSAGDRSFIESGGRSSRGGGKSPQSTRTTQRTRRTQNSSRGLPKSSQIQANTSIPIERLRVDPANKRWVYGSPNFEFICDEDLGFGNIKKFAWMFESVWQFCGTLPFDIPRLRADEKVRMKTYLVKKNEDYIRLGGVPNSLGVYLTAQDVILVPFSSLDLGGNSGGDDGNNTIRHEVTHQLMKGQSQQAGWFIEGSAEYVATVPFDRNRLLTDRHQQAMLSYLTAYGWNGRHGWNLGKKITFGRLEELMKPSYRNFQRQKYSYGYALALFNYFATMDGNKDGARLAKYIEALQDGRPESEAREHLLDGRTYEQLEKELAKGWGALGLRLEFK